MFMRMDGQQYFGDEELLRRTIIRENELEQTVRAVERSASEFQQTSSEIGRQRDETVEEVSAGVQARDESKQ